MKKLTVKQALQLAAERDTDAFMEDMVHKNAHGILDLFVDLHTQLQQEREGQRDQKARLLDLCLKWGAEQAEYPDTDVGKHAAALLRLCVRELYDAVYVQTKAQP